ncbi:hypothetical protein EDB85DRAFT_2149372 [Lactarius pseudohatsudake]|nr:hypothetical protein EDB85DRAFT_2149372 [Lactarius pseudohatsudake]
MLPSSIIAETLQIHFARLPLQYGIISVHIAPNVAGDSLLSCTLRSDYFRAASVPSSRPNPDICCYTRIRRVSSVYDHHTFANCQFMRLHTPDFVVRYDDSETDQNNAQTWVVSETEELNMNADGVPRDNQLVGDERNRNETRSLVGDVAPELNVGNYVFGISLLGERHGANLRRKVSWYCGLEFRIRNLTTTSRREDSDTTSLTWFTTPIPVLIYHLGNDDGVSANKFQSLDS